MGVISLVHRAHATGPLFGTPLVAFVESRAVVAASALAIPLIALVGATLAARLPRRVEPASLPGRDLPRTGRSDGRRPGTRP